jgi:transposase
MMNYTLDVLVLENKQLLEQVKKLTDELTDVKEQLAWFERQVFGQKRETFIPVDNTQYILPLNITPNEVPQKPVEMQTITRKKPDANKTPHSRDEIPAHLPREVIDIKPDFDTTGMTKIADKITEQLEYTPPKFSVKKYVAPVYVGTINGERIVKSPEIPALCIPKGKAGPSVVAQTIISKCVDHIPHYRFAKIINRECGLHLPESTIHDWFRQGTFWLETIAHELRAIAIRSNYLQMDETAIRVMIQPTNGKSRRGNMIVQLAPLEKIVLFDYQLYKNAQVIRQLLTGFKGILQTDGFEVYNTFCTQAVDIRHAGCMDHCRRGFERSLTNEKKLGEYALHEFAILYAVEDQAREELLNFEQRLGLRKEKSQPVLSGMFQWMKLQLEKVRPKSLIGKAIQYALGRQKELSLFCEDGRIEISTIWTENSIRPLAVGRKNFLFAGSEDGARRLAVNYTVLGTCAFNHVNVSRYLPYILEQLPRRKAGDIKDLLPMNWKDPTVQ